MLSPHDSLKKLRNGNERYVAEQPLSHELARTRSQLTESQQPFAVILGCADSRVSPEIIFDQTLGDLFTIRVAGNIVGSLERESIQFATDVLGVKLVVVLGHTGCGAVQATIDSHKAPSENFKSLTSKIRPHIAHILNSAANHASIADDAVEANVRATVKELEAAPFLANNDKVVVVGAVYDLESGNVRFYD